MGVCEPIASSVDVAAMQVQLSTLPCCFMYRKVANYCLAAAIVSVLRQGLYVEVLRSCKKAGFL